MTGLARLRDTKVLSGELVSTMTPRKLQLEQLISQRKTHYQLPVTQNNSIIFLIKKHIVLKITC